ncbi:MAG: S1C family serine protease [Balneolaceae bacterium]|nr:S1C family serine protease [Balneolaceae bacterium]
MTESGNEYKISRVIEQDEELDYIIFKVSGSSNFNTLNIAESRPKIGEEVFAIGNPKGLSHSLSTGIISSYRRGVYFKQQQKLLTEAVAVLC